MSASLPAMLIVAAFPVSFELEADVSLLGHSGNISSVALTPDGRWLLSGSTDKTARLWDLSAQQPDSPVVLSGHERKVSSVAISADGKRAVTGSYDGTARVWNLETRTAVVLQAGLAGSGRGFAGSGRAHAWPINVVALSPNGRWVLTGDIRMTAILWELKEDGSMTNTRSLEIRGTAGPNFESDSEARWLAVSPDGRWAVTGCGNRRDHHHVKLWDLHADDPPASCIFLRGHSGRVDRIAFSRDSRRVITGSWDKTARVWDLTSEDPSPSSVVLSGHESGVCVALHPENAWAVTGSNPTVRIWDLAEGLGATPVELEGHRSYVVHAATSPDGRWAATSGQDETVRIWNMEPDSPEELVTVLPHGTRITTLVFTPDNRLLTGSLDGTIRMWDERR